MDWKDIASDVAKVAPILGTVLGGPAGVALKIGSLVANALGVTGPAEVQQALQTNPDAAVKLREIEKDETLGLRQIVANQAIAEAQAATAQIEAVNKTLQTEAMGGSWLQRNHHAIESTSTVALVWAIYFVLPLCKIAVPAVPETAWITLGAILGVTAWQRGQANKSVASSS